MNSRPMACKAIALPTELPAHYDCFGFIGKRSTVFLLKTNYLRLGYGKATIIQAFYGRKRLIRTIITGFGDRGSTFELFSYGGLSWTCTKLGLRQRIYSPPQCYLWSPTHKMNVLWSNIQHHFILFNVLKNKENST